MPLLVLLSNHSINSLISHAGVIQCVFNSQRLAVDEETGHSEREVYFLHRLRTAISRWEYRQGESSSCILGILHVCHAVHYDRPLRSCAEATARQDANDHVSRRVGRPHRRDRGSSLRQITYCSVYIYIHQAQNHNLMVSSATW